MSSWCKVVLPEVTWLAVMWPEVTWPEVRKYVLRMSSFSRAFFLTRVVVQVPRLPEVINGYVTPSVFYWVCACTTSSCTIFTLLGPIYRKWRYETSPRSERMSSEWVVEGVCACTTAISALVGSFHRKYPLGCSLGRPHLSFSSPG